MSAGLAQRLLRLAPAPGIDAGALDAPPGGAPVTASADVPRAMIDDASVFPSQLLIVESLRRPGESTPYASEDYQTILDGRGITCSMSRRGNCFDNAVMESFFSTVKCELGERLEGYGVAKERLFDYIEVFYNQQRRHSTLGQISPAAFERRAAEGQAA